MKKAWLFFLLLSVLALNTAMAGWVAPAPSKACHTMQMPAADKCHTDKTLLMADCLQSCLSHYLGFPVVLSFSKPLAIQSVFNRVALQLLPDPSLDSPDKPPQLA
ncbi:hypothetical protein [Janthinobacterium sp. B9-8]|uniref:hypothetical protein n=1 Tax=Janthinobacterium sp. B9-8 TaxID=1236179 RepID=UPI00061D05C9|nr:hypothetical protein [Janthinobacterium sp. B9-8]AMC35037.1 hypothetical protein VN23_10645 [Janthinobacterium sp. B9-8]